VVGTKKTGLFELSILTGVVPVEAELTMVEDVILEEVGLVGLFSICLPTDSVDVDVVREVGMIDLLSSCLLEDLVDDVVVGEIRMARLLSTCLLGDLSTLEGISLFSVLKKDSVIAVCLKSLNLEVGVFTISTFFMEV
jgi:hypothetical protein